MYKFTVESNLIVVRNYLPIFRMAEGVCLFFSVPKADPAPLYMKARLEASNWMIELDDIEGSGCILFVSGTAKSYQASAEKFNLRKKCADVPPFQPFNCDNEQDFAGFDSPDTLFTSSEKILLIKKEIDSLRAGSSEKIIPGHQNCTLYKGKSIIRRLLSQGIVTHLQPSHDREELKKIRGTWVKEDFI